MAAMFAAAGEPVTGGDSFGSGTMNAAAFCSYEFVDAGGSTVGVQLNVNPFPLDNLFTACSLQTGPEEGIIVLPGLADNACMHVAGSFGVSVYFRMGAQAGAVNIIWNSRDRVPAPAARGEIAKAIAREWLRLVKTQT
ncbi:MAG TPA: hypothetical protein VHG09_12515 [Longimicrobiales bacterium]|nr:hypothetical protein [Longimicrobiales bacterium]